MPQEKLPAKEQGLFRKLLQCYEMKQYKLGLKVAKQILGNPACAEHGETLALKGLILGMLGRREDAERFVRMGLRNNLISHVCWHVYGLLHRSEKRYDEAIKCYRNALKWDKNNLQIMRELSVLQLHVGDLEGYKETRHHIFMLRPSLHASWIEYALSCHLLGDYEVANCILNTFGKSLSALGPSDCRLTELLLYQNQVLIESRCLQKALDHLIENKSRIADRVVVSEAMGDLYIRLGELEKAVPIFETLIRRNPENVHYYEQYLLASEIHDPDDIIAVYEKFQELYPSAICPRRLPLNFASGPKFRQVADKYLRRGLHKGVPSLFIDVRPLYQDATKVTAFENLMLGYFTSLAFSGHFSRADAEAKVEVEPPSAILFTALFLAQHCDHLGFTERALTFIDVAIEHTPTMPDLYAVKGRIYKHAGDIAEATIWLYEAQSMDTSDRYLNSKCAVYLMRANFLHEADELCGKFTRPGVPTVVGMDEIQCMWFETEAALAHQRLSQWGEALHRCHQVDRYFHDMMDDLFDFHTYCMRKNTLRAYVEMLRNKDILRRSPFYFKAAKCAIEVYLQLYDDPLDEKDEFKNIDESSLQPSELKKLRNKQRKAKKKSEMEVAQAAQAHEKREQYKKAKLLIHASEAYHLKPEQLERPTDPLEKAISFLRPLQQLAKSIIDTHLLAFKVFYRKQKPLLMLQAIRRMQAIDSEKPQLHTCIIRFLKMLSNKSDRVYPPPMQEVLDRAIKELFGNSKTLLKLNYAFIRKHMTSFSHLYEGARNLYELEPKRKDVALNLIISYDLETVRLEDAIYVFTALRDEKTFGDCETAIATLKSSCQRRFPYALDFSTDEELMAKVEKMMNKLHDDREPNNSSELDEAYTP